MLTRCTRCPMPVTRPSTHFHETGECSACAAHDRRAEIDWASRKSDLLRILESAKHNIDGFNVVVPSSGGKDSTYQVLTLIELGARPLVVTATTCMLTSVGRANIDNLARHATTIEVTPNRTVRSVLNRLSLELTGDLSIPEHFSIFATPFKIAAQMGIPLCVYGENSQAAYGGPLGSQEAMSKTRQWVFEFGGFLGLRPFDFVDQCGITARDMADYMLPSDQAMDGINAMFLGQYIPWDSHRNAQVAVAGGMQVRLPTIHSWWNFENLDNAQTGLHDFFKYLKFGFGRVCDQVSVDVRYGMLSREEALEQIKQHDGQFPYEYMGVPYEEVLDKIGISVDAFRRIVKEYTNTSLFGRISDDGFSLTLKEFC